MNDLTRRFILEKTRSKKGVVVDAIGNLGNWPFRRTISYNVGVNCDAIEIQHGLLRVLRRGHTVAVADVPPPAGLLRRSWSALMHPRHSSRAVPAQSAPQWQDLLRPRKDR